MPIGAFKLNTLAKYQAPVASGKTVTLNGGGVISNFVKPPTNGNTWGRSYYNPTASGYVEIAQHNDFAFGTSQDFTVEGFFFFGSTISGKYMFDGRADANSLAILFDGTYLKVYIAGAYRISGAQNAVSPNIWHHIAYTRQGTTGTLWWNGNSVGTWTDTTNYTHSNSIKLMSRYVAGQGSADSYCAGFRISNIARYTTTYSVPTQPWGGDANTLLLLHFDEAAGSTTTQDSSSSAYTPVTYSYDIVPSITSINEEGNTGTSNYITYSIVGPTQNTTYYFTYELNGVAQTPLPTADLDGSESFGVTDYASNTTVYVLADLTTEGNQTLVAKMYSDSGRTNLVATSQSVTIVDTSTDPVSFTYQGNVTSTATTITIPGSPTAQAGDLAILVDHQLSTGSVVPAGWTQINSASTTGIRTTVSYKILTVSDLGGLVSGMSTTPRKVMLIFRPSRAFTIQTTLSNSSQATTATPTNVSMTLSSWALPHIAFAVYGKTTSTLPSRGWTNAISTEVSNVSTNGIYVRFVVNNVGATANNGTVSMSDAGTNTLQTGYISFT